MAYIVIVDSHAEFCQQLIRGLEEAGHRATAVATLSEAASLLQGGFRTWWRRMRSS